MGRPYRHLWHGVTSCANLLRDGSGNGVHFADNPDDWDIGSSFQCACSP